jgi:hypothetical protein
VKAERAEAGLLKDSCGTGTFSFCSLLLNSSFYWDEAPMYRRVCICIYTCVCEGRFPSAHVSHAFFNTSSLCVCVHVIFERCTTSNSCFSLTLFFWGFSLCVTACIFASSTAAARGFLLLCLVLEHYATTRVREPILPPLQLSTTTTTTMWSRRPRKAPWRWRRETWCGLRLKGGRHVLHAEAV